MPSEESNRTAGNRGAKTTTSGTRDRKRELAARRKQLRALLKQYVADRTFSFGHLDRIEVNSKGVDDETPLHMASRRGAVADVELLLFGAAEVDARDDIGATPLHCAVLKGSKPIVELLLAAGADVSARTIDGVTPIRLAEATKRVEILDILRRAAASKA